MQAPKTVTLQGARVSTKPRFVVRFRPAPLYLVVRHAASSGTTRRNPVVVPRGPPHSSLLRRRAARLALRDDRSLHLARLAADGTRECRLGAFWPPLLACCSGGSFPRECDDEHSHPCGIRHRVRKRHRGSDGRVSALRSEE